MSAPWFLLVFVSWGAAAVASLPLVLSVAAGQPFQAWTLWLPVGLAAAAGIVTAASQGRGP